MEPSGVAADLVKTRDEYKGLVQYLLGRVLVVDHMDHAIAIAREIPSLHPHGNALRAIFKSRRLQAAAPLKIPAIFWDGEEMEEMEEACKKALLAVDRIQKELVFQEALLEEKNSSLSSVRTLSRPGIWSRIRQSCPAAAEPEEEELTESSADMNLENRQLEEQMREIRRNIAGLLASMEELEAEKYRQERGDHIRMECFLRRRETSGKKASRALPQIQLEAAGLKQQDSFLDQNLSRLEEGDRKAPG